MKNYRYKNKNCFTCNGKYKPSGANHRYCLKCGIIRRKEQKKQEHYRWKKRNPKERSYIHCLFCNSLTIKTSVKKMFCSRDCRLRNIKKQKGKRALGQLRKRFLTLQRDKFICQYCGSKPPSVQLQIDHKVPKSMGGTNELENLITSCMNCNFGKSDILLL